MHRPNITKACLKKVGIKCNMRSCITVYTLQANLFCVGEKFSLANAIAGNYRKAMTVY